MKTFAHACLAVGLLTASATAFAAPRENLQLKVSTAGVDFADPASVAAFRREVDRQIAQACNPGDRVNADVTPDFKCRAEMAASLEPTVKQLAMRATSRNFATVE